MSSIKLATLNLCLGLKAKKDLVKELLTENKIDILVMQETEIEPDFNQKNLGIPGYTLEMENCKFKKRCGVYISKVYVALFASIY